MGYYLLGITYGGCSIATAAFKYLNITYKLTECGEFICICVIVIVFSNTVCFIQLRNRLNVQHGHMLQAQQRSLLARHQHKDAVIQNIADLQQTVTSPVCTSEQSEMQRAGVDNSRSAANADEANENLLSVSPEAETPSTDDAGSSQAPVVHEPFILKPKAYVQRSFRGSGYSAKSLGSKISSDVPGYSNSSLGRQSSISSERWCQLSSTSPLDPLVAKSSSEVDSDNSSTTNSHVSSPLTVHVNNSAGDEPGKSSGTESGLPIVHMPPLTVSVTGTNVPAPNSQLRSPTYFGGLDVLSTSDSNAVSAFDVGTSDSSEETFSGNSLPLKKPSCVFASKSVIANTYLSRRPPVFCPVHVGTRSDSVDGRSTASSQADGSSTQTNHLALVHTADSAISINPPMTSSLTKQHQPSVGELSVTAASSPLLPPCFSSNKGQSLSYSSSAELYQAYSSSTKPLVSQTVVSEDISRTTGTPSSANSSESLYALLTNAVVSSNSLPAAVTQSSVFVPFPTSSSAAVSSASLVSPVCAPEVLFKSTYSPALVSSDLSVGRASERPFTEVMYSSSATAHTVPQALASLREVSASFPDRLSSSAAAGSPYTTAVSSMDLVSVSASLENSDVSQPVGSNTWPLDKSVKNLPSSGCYTMPCTLTISTHIPVSSPSIDVVATSSHTTLSDAVNNAIYAGSSSSNLIQSCSATTAIDITNSIRLSPSHEVPSSTADERSDRCLPTDIHNVPGAPPRLGASSPRMTRRRLSADGVHANRVSTSPQAAVQMNSTDSLEQTNVTAVVDEAAEECTSDAWKSSVDTGSSEVETDDASSDIVPLEGEPDPLPIVHTLTTKQKQKDGLKTLQRVSFSPLALLLDASLEGDLELVVNTAKKVS